MGNPLLTKYRVVLICLALAVLTFVAFEQVRNNDFIIYDDSSYITNNPNVQKGITYDSFIYAFTSRDCVNWHPLTWLSHMVDCQLYGPNPAGFYLLQCCCRS